MNRIERDAGGVAAQDRPDLLRDVVQGGYCIGCGACASVAGSGLQMSLDEHGQYQPTVVGPAEAGGLRSVCPFSGAGPNETEIGQERFAPEATFHPQIGYHLACFAGAVGEGEFREHGSSGGFGKWIGYELKRRGLVDGVVHVVADPEGAGAEVLYKYAVVEDLGEITRGSKSVYYPVEMSGVLDHVRSSGKRYAFVGVPCFIKTLRLLCRQDPVLDHAVRYCVGLVCGHLKSTFYGEMLGWQEGIEPGRLDAVDFRKKYPGATAREKGMAFTTTENGERVEKGDIVQNYFGTRYDLGFFKYNACDYCDDVVAETADVVVGDAWLPRYVEDGRGTNVVIVRNQELLGLVETAAEEGRVSLDALTADEVAASQGGGFRHRRDGLAYRLLLKERAGEWYPPKRVEPSEDHLDESQKRKYVTRMAIATESPRAYREARQRGSYAYFEATMRRIIGLYETGDIHVLPVLRPIRRGKRLVSAQARRVASRVRALAKRVV